MTAITVPSGSGGASVALSFVTKASASLASQLLGSVYAAATNDSLTAYPVSPSQAAVNEFVIGPNETGSFTVPSGYNVVIDAAIGNVTIVGNGMSNETVVGGYGNFLFEPNGGSGTVVAGGSYDTIEGAGAYALLGDATYTGTAATSTTVPVSQPSSPTSPSVTVVKNTPPSVTVVETTSIVAIVEPPSPTVTVVETTLPTSTVVQSTSPTVSVVEPTSSGTTVVQPASPGTTVVEPVVSTPGEFIIVVSTTGYYNYGTGSGDYFITNQATGPSDIAIDAGASTVSALTDGGIYFENGGSLTFVNAAASTVVGTASSGPTTIFGGNESGAYFQGAASAGWVFVNQASDASIVAGTAGGVVAFNGASGTINLFSGTSTSAANYLVGGTGAETLNAATANSTTVVLAAQANTLSYLSNTNTAAFFVGSGSSTIVGGTQLNGLPDLYAFVNGSAGGTDVILNWSQHNGLIFAGYGAKEDALITTEIDSLPTTSSAVSFKLPDNTTVTIVGMNGSAVNLSTTPTWLS